MKKVENAIETILSGARWLLVPLYLGLTVALALIVMKFAAELWHVVTEFTKPTLTNTKLMLAALDLIDVTLLANLVLMVILSGYRNLVSELDGDGVQSLPPWLRDLDPSGLKMKLFGSIVAISGIQVLRAFMDISGEGAASTDAARNNLGWLLAAHLGLVVSALLLALTEWLSLHKNSGTPRTKSENK